MPRLSFFGGNKELRNQWYRDYRSRNKERVREITRESMRRARHRRRYPQEDKTT